MDTNTITPLDCKALTSRLWDGQVKLLADLSLSTDTVHSATHFQVRILRGPAYDSKLSVLWALEWLSYGISAEKDTSAGIESGREIVIMLEMCRWD